MRKLRRQVEDNGVTIRGVVDLRKNLPRAAVPNLQHPALVRLLGEGQAHCDETMAAQIVVPCVVMVGAGIHTVDPACEALNLLTPRYFADGFEQSQVVGEDGAQRPPGVGPGCELPGNSFVNSQLKYIVAQAALNEP